MIGQGIEVEDCDRAVSGGLQMGLETTDQRVGKVCSCNLSNEGGAHRDAGECVS